MKTVTGFIFMGSKITGDSDCSYEKRDTDPWKKSYGKTRQCIKKQRYHFVDKAPSSQSFCFFQQSRMDMRVGPQRKVSTEELMLSNHGAGEDS